MTHPWSDVSSMAEGTCASRHLLCKYEQKLGGDAAGHVEEWHVWGIKKYLTCCAELPC